MNMSNKGSAKVLYGMDYMGSTKGLYGMDYMGSTKGLNGMDYMYYKCRNIDSVNVQKGLPWLVGVAKFVSNYLLIKTGEAGWG